MDFDGDDFYAGDSDNDQAFYDVGNSDDDKAFLDTADSDDDQAVHDAGDSDDDLQVHDGDELQLRKNFTVLTQSEIRQRMQDDIDRVCSALSVSKTEATTLLIHHNWSVNNVHEAWFGDEGIREKVGLFKEPVVNLSDTGDLIDCGICFESYPRRQIMTANCGHPYCTDCWRSYISSAINDGAGCLVLKCPHPSRCSAAVGADMMEALVTKEEKEKYALFLMHSYIQHKEIKWCPAAGCEFAIAFVTGSENFDVSCRCSHLFCWNCAEEAHRPVDCKTVEKWMLKKNTESENVIYMLNFTKPCPKCKRPIEKNQGCNMMTCRPPCRYQFCWLCLGSYGSHSNCNGYGENDKGKVIEKKAPGYVERYAHYFERWANNEQSMKKALADLKNVEELQIKKLSEVQYQPVTQLKFLTEAWWQIVECRRVLKWTYAYGYYLPDEEKAKKQFFEYLQGQAESGLERLHHCAEREVEPFFFTVEPSDYQFFEYRNKLVHLTSVTRNYFQNLVHALANGLSDVRSSFIHPSASKGVDSFQPQPRKTTKKIRFKKHVNIETEELTIALRPWTCPRCTFINESHTEVCMVCGTGPRCCNRCTYAANPRSAKLCEICSATID